jgi:Icc-related predicted phosphoesterase
MSDYKVTKSEHGGYHKMRAMDTVREHIRFLEGLRKLNAERLVVISHHAPHWNSIAKHYQERGGDLNYAYFSDLTQVMIDHNPVFWFHGHVHNRSDYQAPHTQTRVVANPWGYQGEEVELQFSARVDEYEL